MAPTAAHLYFDHNATAPLRPAARDAMIAVLDQGPGNASSIHSFGRAARKAIEDARAQVATLVGAAPKQIIFNSGATEGNNTILRGFAPGRILIGATEHSSIIECGTAMQAEKIPVDTNGLIDLDDLEKRLREKPTALVSIMLANNETGVIQNIAEVATIAHAHGAAMHTDAVQAAGKITLDMAALGVDFMTISSHKIGGPQGVGALVIADGSTSCLPPPVLMLGGGQERRARAGTENTAGIAAFGAAARAAHAEINTYATRAQLRDKIEAALQSLSNAITVHGTAAPRIGNTTCLTIKGIEAQTMLMALDLAGIAISSGSACSSGVVKPSHVLTAMGVDPETAKSGLRISLGWNTTPDEVDSFISIFTQTLSRLLRN